LSAVAKSLPKLTRDDLVRLVGLSVLLAVGVWIARNTYWEEVSVPAHPRGEAAADPYYGILHLAGDLGLHARTVGSLSALPARDAVILLDAVNIGSLPQPQLLALEHWVTAGGRLILAGHVLTASTELRRWTGIKPVLPHGRPAGAAGTAAPSRFAEPQGPSAPGASRNDCPPMGVSIDGMPTGENLRVCDVWVGNGYTSEIKPSWALRDAAGMQVLRITVGTGSVTVIGPTQLYANTELFAHQHARVFVEASALLHGDTLWILAPSRAETLLALLWRLGAPAMGFLGMAIACSVWRDFPRFGPLSDVPPSARRSLAEQIRANARFAWRSRSLAALHAAALRGVEASARRHIVAFDGLDRMQRLAVIAARSGIAPAELEAAMGPGASRRPRDERAAIALLEQARRSLQSLGTLSTKDAV